MAIEKMQPFAGASTSPPIKRVLCQFLDSFGWETRIFCAVHTSVCIAATVARLYREQATDWRPKGERAGSCGRRSPAGCVFICAFIPINIPKKPPDKATGQEDGPHPGSSPGRA